MKHAPLVAALLLVLAACRQPPTPVRTHAQPPPRPITTPAHIDVVALGDSLARGTGDESGAGLTGRLEAALRDRGIRSVDTLNLGINGAQTGDVIETLRDPKVRRAVAAADAIVLSAGANDLAQSVTSRDMSLPSLLNAADGILDRIALIVDTIHDINPHGRILILGAYDPVPNRPEGRTIDQYLGIWDSALTRRFDSDTLVQVVKMSDIVVPARLSRLDHFHPGGEAYEAAARRIAGMLMEPV